MRLSIKLAILAAVTATAHGKRDGLTQEGYNSLLHTDLNSFITDESDLQALTHMEWDRAAAAVEDKTTTFPYMVCSSTPRPSSGYQFKQRVESHFGDNFYVIANSPEQTCLMVSSVESVASTAPEDMVVQPVLAEMKMARGTVNHFLGETHTGRLGVMLCPGRASTESEAVTLAKDILSTMKEVVTSKDETTVKSMSRKLGIKDTDECNSVTPIIEGGNKGESAHFELPQGANPSCLASIAKTLVSSPHICYLEVTPDLKLLNAQAQWILQSGVEESRPWFDAGLNGTGIVVAISDSGVDMENCYFLDGHGNVNKRGFTEDDKRKVIQYYPFLNDSDDAFIGHGTHVSATVAGRKAIDGIHESTGEADGMAIGAKIAFMDIGFGPLVIAPFRTENLFLPGFRAGAHLHSASWGANIAEYDLKARGFDDFTYENPEFLSVVAAGNSGAKCNLKLVPCPKGEAVFDIQESVGAPATAKNIISVGATESYGPELTEPWMLGYEYLTFFSSRGPTADGRLKPEVVAPGYNILSAASKGKKDIYSCDNVNEGTKFMAGTSMAAPATSGIAALVQEYFQEGWYPSGTKTEGDEFVPSAALVKAVLLNGAQDLKGVSNMGSVSQVAPYDNNQGFGRVSLIDSLYLAGHGNAKLWVKEGRVTEGGEKKIELEAALTEECDSKILSITLTWTDPGAFPSCRRCVSNDLDLIVIITYENDNGEVQEKRLFPNGLEEEDTKNNAERTKTIIEEGMKIGVTVFGKNLVSREENYALAINGCVTTA